MRQLLFSSLISAAEPAESILCGRGFIQIISKPPRLRHDRNGPKPGIFHYPVQDGGRCCGKLQHNRTGRIDGTGTGERCKDYSVSIQALESEHRFLRYTGPIRYFLFEHSREFFHLIADRQKFRHLGAAGFCLGRFRLGFHLIPRSSQDCNPTRAWASAHLVG